MTKEFVEIGCKFNNKNTDPNIKDLLLHELSKCIRSGQLNADKLKLEFKTYEIDEYKDGRSIIDKAYRNKFNELYWCCTKYDTIDDLISALSEQKYFMVLTAEECMN